MTKTFKEALPGSENPFGAHHGAHFGLIPCAFKGALSTGKFPPPCPLPISKFKDKDTPQEELEHFFTEEMVILGLIWSANEAKLFLDTSSPMTGPYLLAQVQIGCCCLVPESYLTLLRPHGQRSPPGSSVHGISQARIAEWVAISFSRGSS